MFHDLIETTGSRMCCTELCKVKNEGKKYVYLLMENVGFFYRGSSTQRPLEIHKVAQVAQKAEIALP